MIDFADLRNRILYGEGEEDEPSEPSGLSKEMFLDQPLTGFATILGGATVAFCGLDKMKFELLGQYRIPVFVGLGVAPLMFGLGRLTRGFSAQEQISRYETLVAAAENAARQVESEAEEKSAEEDNKQAQDDDYHYDLLWDGVERHHAPTATAQNVSFGAFGDYGASIGQEQVAFRPESDSLRGPRPSWDSTQWGY